ncbi:hypothetical protein QBK99_10910 [Corticibacterium sp. UT-5YL-CI-8]|nr:hypothetical protein [Tianweitania sp. UT-5YL-CI-8]
MARFKLPPITYPLTIDTVGKTLALGHEIEAFCHTKGCGHKARINLVSYAKRFGLDAPCGHDDLVKVYYCPRCREAGRPDKNLTFIHQALTAEHSCWPRQERSVNPYERAKGR